MSDLCIYLGNRHPCIIVIDNALCWVMKHRRHAEAIINPSFANHMQGLGICVEAAPPYAPKRYPEFLLNQKNYPKMHLYAA